MNNAIFFAVLANETDGYGYGVLADIARNSILQCRDMYLRPDYYAETENTVKALISDLITEVESGAKNYDTARKEAYIKILQSANAAFNPETLSQDFCYWDIPAVDSVMFTQARKLLKNARSRAEQNAQK